METHQWNWSFIFWISVYFENATFCRALIDIFPGAWVLWLFRSTDDNVVHEPLRQISQYSDCPSKVIGGQSDILTIDSLSTIDIPVQLGRIFNGPYDPNICYIDGVVRDCSISSALTMAILQFCTEPSLCSAIAIALQHEISCYTWSHCNSIQQHSISFYISLGYGSKSNIPIAYQLIMVAKVKAEVYSISKGLFCDIFSIQFYVFIICFFSKIYITLPQLQGFLLPYDISHYHLYRASTSKCRAAKMECAALFVFCKLKWFWILFKTNRPYEVSIPIQRCA